MAKPSKKKPPTPSSSIPGSVWLLNLGLATAFLGFLYYLSQLPEPTEPAAIEKIVKPAEKTAPSPTTKAPPQVDFKYEEILPQTRVVPPNVKDYEPKADAKRYEYLLQTGSFRKRDDAEQQKANIALVGLRASISEIRRDDGQLWYRVEVGPIASRSKMNQAVDRLIDIRIQPIVRKREIGAAKP